MLSKFTHSLCSKCYTELEPGRTPARIVNPRTETCCNCGVEHKEGIYYRSEPAKLKCKGVHIEGMLQQ